MISRLMGHGVKQDSLPTTLRPASRAERNIMIYEIEEATEKEVRSRIWWGVTTWDGRALIIASTDSSQVKKAVKAAGYRPLHVHPTTTQNALYAVNHGEKIYEAV